MITIYKLIIKNPSYCYIKPYYPIKIDKKSLQEIIRDFDVQAIISDKIIYSFEEKIILWTKNHEDLYVSNIYEKYNKKLRRSPRLNKFWCFDKNIEIKNIIDDNERYNPVIQIDYDNKIIKLN